MVPRFGRIPRNATSCCFPRSNPDAPRERSVGPPCGALALAQRLLRPFELGDATDNAATEDFVAASPRPRAAPVGTRPDRDAEYPRTRCASDAYEKSLLVWNLPSQREHRFPECLFYPSGIGGLAAGVDSCRASVRSNENVGSNLAGSYAIRQRRQIVRRAGATGSRSRPAPRRTAADAGYEQLAGHACLHVLPGFPQIGPPALPTTVA